MSPAGVPPKKPATPIIALRRSKMTPPGRCTAMIMEMTAATPMTAPNISWFLARRTEFETHVERLPAKHRERYYCEIAE